MENPKARREEENKLELSCEKGHKLTRIDKGKGAYWCETCKEEYKIPRDCYD